MGTKQADRIVGTRKRDIIVAKGGNDRIYGRGGNDLICAGAGNDLVYGGPGRDRVYGQVGRDRLFGNAGPDFLAGQVGNDRLNGGTGIDPSRPTEPNTPRCGSPAAGSTLITSAPQSAMIPAAAASPLPALACPLVCAPLLYLLRNRPNARRHRRTSHARGSSATAADVRATVRSAASAVDS